MFLFLIFVFVFVFHLILFLQICATVIFPVALIFHGAIIVDGSLPLIIGRGKIYQIYFLAGKVSEFGDCLFFFYFMSGPQILCELKNILKYI